MNRYASFGANGSLNNESIEYTALYATGQYLKFIPTNSILHIANSNSIRLSNYFTVDESVEIYGNRDSHGIDGSMSAFIGHAHIISELSFLLIGDF